MVKAIQRIGLLTGGGDAAGLNPAIATIVEQGSAAGFEVVGIFDGWKGILNVWEHSCKEKELIRLLIKPLTLENVSGIKDRGGTILYTSRTNPKKIENGLEKVVDNLKKLGIDVLIPIGGEDTLGVAIELQEMGINIIGIPKTIDNDIGGTTECIGFSTAVERVASAMRDLHTTAESHHRIMVMETMGRNTGWIAFKGGIIGGAEYILIPEIFKQVMNIEDEILRKKKSLEQLEAELRQIIQIIELRKRQGKLFSMITIAEGLEEIFINLGLANEIKEKDMFGHKQYTGGVAAAVLAKALKDKTGLESRIVVLGHLQRAGSPNKNDIELASEFGSKAIELVKKEKFGRMVAKIRGRITHVPLELAKERKEVPIGLVRKFIRQKYKVQARRRIIWIGI